MGYRLSQRAKADLVEIYVEGVRMFGALQAERYHLSLERAFDVLAAFPQAASERSEIRPPVRVHPHKAHVIVYTIDERGIRVLRIRHAHEDWSGDPVG